MVGVRKTNRHSNRGLQDTKVGSELVFAKPTVIPNFGLNIRGLERGWFSRIQLSIQPLPLMHEGWKTVGFRQSNCQSNRCRSCMRVGKRLVIVNPTVVPTMCFKERRLERCWFSQIQLSIQPLPRMYKGWNTVGFRQSNCHSNHVL